MQNPSKNHLHVYKSGSDGNKTMYKELYHHGILGQRWGKRNGPPYPLGASDHSQREKRAGWRKSLRGKSSDSERISSRKQREGLSGHQKTAIKVGVGLVAAALVAYGGYKLYKSDVGQHLVSNVLNRNTEAHSTESKGYSGEAWVKHLTPGELTAVRNYTSTWFRHGNRALRHAGEARLTELDRKIVKDLDSAIDKYVLNEEATFTRYSSPKILGGADSKEAIKKLIGSIVHDDGYTSSTMGSARVDTGFGTYDKVTYLIKTPPGKGIGAYVDPVSANQGENEFLFARGSDFEITDVFDDLETGKLVVRLLYKGITRSDI